MYTNTSGLVLRETAYKDSGKILTVLTADEGKLTVSARGARRRNSKLAAATQLLVYSEMTLYEGRAGRVLTEARSIEQFHGLRNDVVLLAHGSYFAQLAEAASDEDSPGRELLPLCLNALFALSEAIKTPEYVKPAFELKLMELSGFAPAVDRCCSCGAEAPETAMLDIDGGVIRCGDCAPPGADMLGAGVLRAMRYILSCNPKKLFSFTLGATALRELSRICESYLLSHLDRDFRTLDYLKKL
ncbi:MAG: DNA repair protein RecO [Oscillospiraceae bacterium]|nr:DNA repair protein RecO [Oscillospiraceae bacterium]